MYVVRRPFRSNIGMLVAGSVIEPASIKRFKHFLREGRIVLIQEHNYEQYAYLFKARFGVDIPPLEGADMTPEPDLTVDEVKPEGTADVVNVTDTIDEVKPEGTADVVKITNTADVVKITNTADVVKITNTADVTIQPEGTADVDIPTTSVTTSKPVTTIVAKAIVK